MRRSNKDYQAYRGLKMWAAIYNRGRRHCWVTAASARYVQSRCGLQTRLRDLMPGKALPKCRTCDNEVKSANEEK
jgi:hypothetical protein